MHYLKSIYQLVSCQGRNCFYSSIKKKMKKIEQSKGSVQGPLCICILFQAFVASNYNRFTFLNKQNLEFKNNKIFITFTIINIQVCFIKNYFFFRKNTK